MERTLDVVTFARARIMPKLHLLQISSKIDLARERISRLVCFTAFLSN